MKVSEKPLFFISLCFLFGFSVSSCDLLTLEEEYVCCVDFPPPTLHQAVEKGDLKEVRRLVEEKGVDIYSVSRGGYTVLEAASYHGQGDVLLFFIKKGMDVNIKTYGGNTLLHEAKNREVAKILLDNGVGINIQDDNDRTPLFESVLNDKIKLALFLIENGADPNIPEDDGNTPLYIAVGKEEMELARRLFEKGANPYFKNKNGNSPLILANRKAGPFDFSLKKLIKLFESYTPPEPSQSPSEEATTTEMPQFENKEIVKPDTLLEL